MSSSFSRDSTPLSGNHSFKANLQKWLNFEGCHFYLWECKHSLGDVSLACVPRWGLSISKPAGEASSLPTDSLKNLGKGAQWEAAQKTAQENPRRGICSGGLFLLLYNNPLPTIPCLPLASHSAPGTRSSIHRSKGQDFLRWAFDQPFRLSQSPLFITEEPSTNPVFL